MRIPNRYLLRSGGPRRGKDLSAQNSNGNREMNDTRLSPEYSIYSHSCGEPLHTVELHVLARAYRATWRSLFASDPRGPHVISALDVLFVFSAQDPEIDR